MRQREDKQIIDAPAWEQVALEQHRDGIGALDSEGRLLEGNRAFYELVGRQADAVMGQCFADLVVAAERERVLSLMRQALRGEGSSCLTTLDGAVGAVGASVEVDVRLVPWSEAGRLHGLIVYLRPVEQQRALERELASAQQQLEQTESKLVRAQRMASMGMWELDLSSGTVTQSKELERIFGVEGEQTTYAECMQLVHPEDLAVTENKVNQALQDGQSYDVECRIVRPSGEIRHVEIHAEVLLGANGQPTKYFGTLQDVTERKTFQTQLNEAEERFQMIAQNMTDVISLFNRDGILLYASPSHEQLLGYPAEWFIGRSATEWIHPDDIEHMRQLFLRTVQTGELMTADFRARCRAGTWTLLEGRGVPVWGSDGQVERIVTVCRDVTERRQTEELLLQSEKLSVAGQLAAGIAHEIRNPLTALKGFLQLMSMTQQAKGEYLDVMFSELNRIELILSELLVLAKPQAITFKPKDIRDILTDVLTLIETQANLNSIVIASHFASNLRPLLGDENQLKQVFINFFKNAIEAMPDGGTVLLHVLPEGDHTLLVRIIDQGVGIPPERIPKLGQPFYTTKEKGTGLGLMVSYKILDEHGGTVQIASQVGAGTTISVRLPMI